METLTQKSWYKSKTVWFNALTILTVVATVFGYTPDPELTNKATGILVTLSPVVNLVLRLFFTKKEVVITQ